MKFLRNCWYVAGFADEASTTAITRTFLDEEVALFRTADGVPAALGNRCPHRFAPLHQGPVVGDALQCPYHGLRFGTDGACVHVPSGGQAPPHTAVKSYPVVERYQLLWIWMGDRDRADPALIPDFAYLEDENYGWYHGTMLARANYQLVIDNLLDLSHAEFLHPMLSSDGWTGRNEAHIEQGERSLRIKNVAEKDNVIPIMAQMYPDIEKLGTTIHNERWEAPSLLHLSVEYYASNGQVIIPSGHFLTPETDSTTHYFLRGGQSVAPGNDAVTAAARAGVLAIFEGQDIPILEAQQAYLGDTDLMAAKPAILKSDTGAIRVRRLLAKLIRDEQGGDEAVAVAAE